MVFLAVCDIVSARATMKSLRHTSNEEVHIVHGFSLNMGDFCLRSRDGRRFHQLTCQDLHDSHAFEPLRATSDPNDADSLAGISIALNTEDKPKNWIHELITFSQNGISALLRRTV